MYYFRDRTQEEIQPEFTAVGSGNGEVVGIRRFFLEGGGYSLLIRIPLANYPVVVGFKISETVGDRLFDNLDISYMEDIVGREFTCFTEARKNLDIAAIFPARFDGEEKSYAA